MPEKLKNFFKCKLFINLLIIVPLVILILLFTWPLPKIFVVDLFLTIYGFSVLYWRSLIVWSLFAGAVVIFIMYLWPFIKYLTLKICNYISLHNVCRKNKYQIKTVRSPFVFSKQIRQKEDIKIVTPQETYCIHFVDVIYPSRSVVVVLDSGYTITSKKSRKQKHAQLCIPDFSGDVTETHVFTVQSLKLEARIEKSNRVDALTSHDTFDGMTFFYFDHLMRMLRR